MASSLPPPPADPPPVWRARWQRLGGQARAAAPFLGGMAAALAAMWLYGVLLPPPAPLTAQEVNASVATAIAAATAPPAYSARVYQAIQPSLVLIQTQAADTPGEAGQGLGTGVVVSEDGAILTSLHVVEGAAAITLTFADGTRSEAAIIAAQPEDDIAVLQASRLPDLLVPAVLGNPNAQRVGDEAFVVGHPFGLYNSLSAGVISGFERSFQPPGREAGLDGLIQVDAAINPGNSGGPLLNRQGQVIGIVVGIVNPTEQNVFVGIGFAVPITVAAQAAGLPSY